MYQKKSPYEFFKTERKTCQDNDHKGVYSYKHIPLTRKEP